MLAFLEYSTLVFHLRELKIKKKNNTISWITLGIKKSCKRKRELFRLVRDSNNPVLKRYYKTYSRILAKVIKEAKRLSYNSRILKSNNKVKTTWNIINDLVGKQRSTNSILKLSTRGNLLTNPNDIAEAFNKYFLSIISIRNRNNLENTRNNTTSTYSYLDLGNGNRYSPMVFKSFSSQEIISIIKSLKAKDSFGYDEVSPRLLKICAGYISSPLTYICNKAISTGIFPDCLKYSIIKLLYKKGDRLDPANYRPISMLTSFSKYKYINKNILNDHQFGFRKSSRPKMPFLN